jgi:hypothetical protein
MSITVRNLKVAAVRAIVSVSLALAIVAVGVRDARAGFYDVRDCREAGGTANAATAYISDSTHLILSNTCTLAGGDFSQGYIARTVNNDINYVAPNGTFAKWLFIAPSGATISDAWLNGHRFSGANGWRRGLDSNAGDFAGYGPWDGSIGVPPNTPPYSPTHIPISPGATALGWGIQCANGAGCRTYMGGGTEAGRATLNGITVRVQDYSAPSMSANSGALWGGGWHRGYEEAWTAYDDNVGIRLIRLVVDSNAVAQQDFADSGWPAGVRCDYSFMRPCNTIPNGGLGLNTATLADGPHALRLDVMDAAGNWSGVDRALNVDNTSPGAPSNLTVVGGQGWRSTNSFNITWSNPGGQTAPIIGARYRICQVDQPASCVENYQSGNNISALSNLGVPNGTVGDYTLEVRLRDEAGNEFGSWSDASFVAGPVHLRFDNQAPGRAEAQNRNGWLNAQEAAQGESVRMDPAAFKPVSGIVGYSVTLDGSTPDNTVDVAGESATYDISTVPSGRHTFKAKAVSGSGIGSTEVASVGLQIDKLAPDTSVTGAPDPGVWQRQPVALTLTGTDQPGLSGMTPADPAQDVTAGAYMTYRIDGANAQRVRGDKAQVTLDEDGAHTVRYMATDVAGNNSTEKTLVVRVDRRGPVGVFATQDPDAPRVLRVSMTDDASGPNRGQIQLRRIGSWEWRDVPTRFAGGELVAALDDQDYAPGVYEFRAFMRDVAGNESVTDRTETGSQKVLNLPLRIGMQMAIGKSTDIRSRCRLVSVHRTISRRGTNQRITVTRRICRITRRAPQTRITKPINLTYGNRYQVTGLLATAEGAPIANAAVDVQERNAMTSATFAHVATVHTDSSGAFSYRIRSGPSRTVRFGYDGSEKVLPSSAEMVVQVAAPVQLTVSPQRTRNGGTVTFRGRLVGGPWPTAGNQIAIEAVVRGVWRTFRLVRADKWGRFTTQYRFEATFRTTAYRFRAVALKDSNYPFEAGHSRAQTVIVRP